jgi:hypothetical protein
MRRERRLSTRSVSNMNWQEALEIVLERTKHERYRVLCADDHPDHDAWREQMVAKATGEAPPEKNYPPIVTQVKNLFRAVRVFARSGFKLTPRKARLERLAICRTCEWFDESGPIARCKQCGCSNSAKVWIATDGCPLIPPKWGPVTLDEQPPAPSSSPETRSS